MSSVPGLLSEVAFGALLQYSPRGTGEVSRRSRVWRDAVKRDTSGAIAKAVDALANRPGRELEHLRSDLFGADVVVVPTPRSVPLTKGALWPAARICEEIVAHGLASEVLPLLQRAKPVPKSAFAARGERPSAQLHFESLRLGPELIGSRRVLVVDDIVTKGATLLAAASLVQRASPQARVLCLALIRTMGLVPEIEQILAPCVGTIRLLQDGAVVRDP